MKNLLNFIFVLMVSILSLAVSAGDGSFTVVFKRRLTCAQATRIVGKFHVALKCQLGPSQERAFSAYTLTKEPFTSTVSLLKSNSSVQDVVKN